jgi:hypothetical protein
MQDAKIDCFEQTGELAVEIGDLDLKRNLKLRAFVGLVLTPVFRDLQPQLRYAEMGKRGVTAMQYYADFENFPAPFGYGDNFTGRYQIRLCRSASDERREAEGGVQRVERLIVETRATLTGRQALGAPASLGFEPDLGAPAIAGNGRVLHVLTRPHNPPGQRWVSEIPHELDFLAAQPLEGPYPTMPQLAALDDGFTEIAAARQDGLWGLANSDVYQHIHAREYIFAMENSITAALAEAGIAPQTYGALRARMIFRRPSFVGQRYAFGVRLYRRGDAIVALGALHNAGEVPFTGPERPAVYLRFEGWLVWRAGSALRRCKALGVASKDEKTVP